MIDASPALGPNKLHTSAEEPLRIGNGWGFVVGNEPSGTDSNVLAVLTHAEYDRAKWKDEKPARGSSGSWQLASR